MSDDKKNPKKYLDKFETDEDLAKGYAELEKKLGKQGEDYGQTKKQLDEAKAALQQYAEAVTQMKPIADWYAQNQAQLTAYGQWLTAQQNAALGNAPAQGATVGNRTLDLLTAEEKAALMQESARTFEANIFKPWMEKYNTQLQKMAEERQKAVIDQIGQQQRAFTEVLWRTMQRGLPEDKIKEMRTWHEQALAMADPAKFDPMKAADEYLSTQARLSKLEEEKKALESEREKWQKDSLASLSGAGSAPVAWAAKDETAPKSRDERMQRVFSETQEAIGRDAFRDFFAGSGSR